MKAKSVLIIGMGKFGTILGTKLVDLGNDVMVVDKDEETINTLSSKFPYSLIGNCTNIEVLNNLGINNFDICFVCIGDDFQSSLEITSLLKDLGAKYVISKANRYIQAKFLLKNGADEIVYPERDVAIKLAIRCNTKNVFDFIELGDEYAIFEISTPSQWVNKSLLGINVRQKFRINVLAYKKGEKLYPLPGPDYVFNSKDHIVVLGKHNDITKIISSSKN